MVTIIQEVMRFIFYILSAYGIILVLKLIRKNWDKKSKSCFLYVVTSMVLLVSLGNIVIFNIDMYDAILGTMEVHTIVYALLLSGGMAAVYFLRELVKAH